jgi:hypothetical protein
MPKCSELIPVESVKSVEVVGDFVEVTSGIDYYGTDDGYNRHETSVCKIVDKSGMRVDIGWTEKWTEIVPGIEARQEEEVTKGGSQEHVRKQSIRIYRSACPVYVQFRHTYEYVDYDKDGQYSSYKEWHRYEVANSEDK